MTTKSIEELEAIVDNLEDWYLLERNCKFCIFQQLMDRYAEYMEARLELEIAKLEKKYAGKN